MSTTEYTAVVTATPAASDTTEKMREERRGDETGDGESQTHARILDDLVLSDIIRCHGGLETERAEAAGGGRRRLALAPAIIRGQSSPITVAGKPVEIAIAPISRSTVRISVRPIVNGKPQAGRQSRRARRRPRSSAWQAAIWSFACTKAPSPSITITRSGPAGADADAGPRRCHRVVRDRQRADLRARRRRAAVRSPRHRRIPSRNGQGGYQLRTHGGRVPIQWLVSPDGWGMYIHQPLGSFDLIGSLGRFMPSSDALPLDVFVVGSDDPKTIIGEYARITGYAELPPLWSFGYMQSHRTLAGPDEINWVARTFREKKLPCDALIYLGTEFTPSGWNTRNGEFGWKPENFPDPKKFIDEMHAQHYKVVLHIVIEGQRMSGAVADPCTPDKAVPSGRTPTIAGRADRAVPCYWPYHKPLYDLGVDGMWPDQGDGLDEPSRLARIRMYWEGPQQYRPNERPFALHRNGSPGMQRYGAFLWSGDVYSFWETLKTHVPVAINTGLSGIPFWGTDIGGFVPTADYTGELHVRWFQFGTFCPSFRSHGRNWHLRLPWGWNMGKIGPSELRGYTGGAADPDPKELNNPQVEPIVKKYLELRYRLLPYTYTIARECCDTGLPMMRALWLHHHDDRAGGRARRSVPVGPRHPGVAGRREGRDVAASLSAARRVVRFLDRAGHRRRPRDRSRGRSRDDAAARARRRDHSDGTGQAVHRRARRRAADASRSIPAPTARSRCTKTTARRSRTSAATSCGWR